MLEGRVSVVWANTSRGPGDTRISTQRSKVIKAKLKRKGRVWRRNYVRRTSNDSVFTYSESDWEKK